LEVSKKHPVSGFSLKIYPDKWLENGKKRLFSDNNDLIHTNSGKPGLARAKIGSKNRKRPGQKIRTP
jgi:hypothetical protein